MSAAVAHRFAAHHVAGDREALAEFAASTVRWTFWPSLAAMALILALGKPILWLFGPDFAAGYPLMFILAIEPDRARRGRPGRARAQHAGRAAPLRADLCRGVRRSTSPAPLRWRRATAASGVAIVIAIAITVESALLFVIAKRRLGLHLLIWQPRAKQ